MRPILEIVAHLRAVIQDGTVSGMLIQTEDLEVLCDAVEGNGGRTSLAKYRKKPIVIDAILWEGGDYECLNTFCGDNWTRADSVGERGPSDEENIVVFNSLERQWLNVPVGHWIIRGIKGELYPCAPEVFDATYEQV